MLGRFTSALTAVLIVTQGPVAIAAAPETDPAATIEALNSEAITAFETYSFNKGLAKLDEAIAAAATHQLKKSPQLAATHALRAVGVIAGKDDLYRGLYYFTAALRMDPKVEAPKKLMSPQIAYVLKGAVKAHKALGRTPPKVTLALFEEKVQTALDTVRKDERGLVHDPVDEARAGYHIPVTAAAGVDIRASAFYVYFRAAGKVRFERIKMKLLKGAYRTSIPKRVTSGRYLHYYIEARDQRGRIAASHGSQRSPNVVTLSAPAKPAK